MEWEDVSMIIHSGFYYNDKGAEKHGTTWEELMPHNKETEAVYMLGLDKGVVHFNENVPDEAYIEGVLFENGKFVAQWETPDGSLYLPLATEEVEAAIFKAKS